MLTSPSPVLGPKRGMVLAAGLGVRLRPITDHIPKPMVPVGGRTLIDRALDHFERAGVLSCVVNLHYKGDMLRRHLEGRANPTLIFSDETGELLETGGGVKKALPHLGNDPIFIANADVLWLDGAGSAMRRLANAWDGERMDSLLLLMECSRAHGYGEKGDFLMDASGLLQRRPQNQEAPFVFAGVQILHPRLFENAPEGRFSLNILFDRAIKSGRLFGLAHDGEWYHVGTPEALAEAERDLGTTVIGSAKSEGSIRNSY